MFAFVLFDRRSRRIFAARDRFGVKPLYIWKTPTGGVAFASEIKQFLCHPGWRPRTNGQRVYDFIVWGVCDHTSETIFADVAQLRGGEFISAPLESLTSARPQRWYELRGARFDGNLVAAGVRFRDLLEDSVRLRLRADVPVGSCLSGGLDSSSVVCTIQAQLGERAAARQKTFSAYSDVARFDEREFIQEVVRTTGIRGHDVIPDPADLLRELEAITWHQDEPFGSTSIYAQWCVFRLARQNGVVVMLDGQGADESLAGYHTYFAPRLAGLFARGRWVQLLRESRSIQELHGLSREAQLRRTLNHLLPPGLADRLRALTGRMVFAPGFVNLKKLQAEARSPLATSTRLRDGVRALSRGDLLDVTLPRLLHWEDRDSMAHSIEARLPYLDYRLVEFCLGLPEEFKLRDGWTKRVMREGMRGRLPERVRMRRDKLGFATAEEVWMRETHHAAFRQLAEEAIDAAGEMLTPEARSKTNRMLNGDEPFDFLVWRFISFGQWLRRFNVEVLA